MYCEEGDLEVKGDSLLKLSWKVQSECQPISDAYDTWKSLVPRSICRTEILF